MTPTDPAHGATPQARTRTPAALKWLLNERAAIAGDIATLTVRLAAQALKVAKAQEVLDGLNRAIAGKQAKMAAFDTTMELAYRNVEPSAAGVVRAWAGKYGKRGALAAFLVQELRDAAPAAITTTLLIDLAIQRFGLPIETSADRVRFLQAVSRQLRKFHEKGLTIPMHDRSKTLTGVWRWKGSPTHAELSALATRESGHEAGAVPSTHPDPT